MRTFARIATFALLALSACGSDEDALSGRSGKTAKGLYTVTYATRPDPIPFSELFELDVMVKDGSDKTVENASLAVKVTMPAHGHGMQTKPEVAPGEKGKFVVSGMKFHMRGEWQINFTVQAAAGTDDVTFTENLQ